MALLEARPYRPFKSSEEYLEAMKEDLAEWLSTLYPELMINAENFMDRLDTGVALCKHANYVRQAAEDYLARRQARNKSMTRSMTSGLAGPILALGNVHYLPAAKSGTFFARDNVSNFITWCRKSLKIIECLLFETDDLILRKNEKHVILCLLEVARRGAKFGMLAPMLVQMERQIDREIAADNKANGIGCGTQTGNGVNGSDTGTQTDANGGIGVGTDSVATATDIFDTDSENEDENDDGPMLMYGPQPQIITNDLKSLDEMVRDLVEKCTCPSQFPMVRVSEGKYRIGDTKVLIFVRILRSHVMVRVGGGWDTLSHYLDKHDPCRCKAQHRTSVAARLIPRSTNQVNGGIELHKAQVIFERSPPTARRIISNFNNQSVNHTTNGSGAASATMATTPNSNLSPSFSGGGGGVSGTIASNISTNNAAGVKQRSRSPTPQRKFFNQTNGSVGDIEKPTGSNATAAALLTSPSLARRSMSPSPRRLIDMRKKQSSLDSNSISNSGPKSLPSLANTNNNDSVTGNNSGNHVQFESNLIQDTNSGNGTTTATTTGGGGGGGIAEGNTTNGNSNKFENISDNGSEISDEGYRSLGVIQSNAQKRESLHSQASIEDAESNARLDQTSSDSQLSPVDDPTTIKVPEILENDYNTQHEGVAYERITSHQHDLLHHQQLIDAGPQSLPAVLSLPETTVDVIDGAGSSATVDNSNNKFEQSGVFITDEEITVDIASSTGLRKTGFSSKIFSNGSNEDHHSHITQQNKNKGIISKIPRSPVAQRRRSSIDNSTCATSGSLQDLSTRTGLPVFNRKKPVYRSVRKSPLNCSETQRETPTPPPRHHHHQHHQQQHHQQQQHKSHQAVPMAVRDVTNTWSGRTTAAPTLSTKKRPIINADTFTTPTNTAGGVSQSSSPSTFDRNVKTRSSQILYDSNGRRVRGCTSSLTTSPVKNHAASPLAQQLLEAASSAKNDAQILEKMKALLSRYAASNNQTGNGGATMNRNGAAASTSVSAASNVANTAAAGGGGVNGSGVGGKKAPVYEDFTTAWVHSNGNLERSNSCSPPTKTLSKRSSAASSCDSTTSRDVSVVVSPRRERGMSKIPAPVRQHTELY